MTTVRSNPIIQSAARATLDDLYRVEGKAELIGGRIVHPMASGHRPTKIAMRIGSRLDDYAARIGKGEAYSDGIGFAIRPPLSSGRESFSPDASYYVGALPKNEMRFVEGAPIFAVEVRSEDDYGPAAERAMGAKRADYFEAGTQVVWDVDPVARTIACFRAASPAQPIVFKAGDVADAEPAVPGWTVAVDEILDAAK
jgi:Uma2 family endonuclease